MSGLLLSGSARVGISLTQFYGDEGSDRGLGLWEQGWMGGNDLEQICTATGSLAY